MYTDKEYLTQRDVVGLRCESVGEYSLPDYNGDIKKILMVKVKALPSGRFASDESLEICGSVFYEVVYLDSENCVTHAEFNTDYDAAIKINPDNYVDSFSTTSVSSYNIRLVGPRKISVKCILESDVIISERRSYNVVGDTFSDHVPEMKSVSALISTPCIATNEPVQISEDIMTLDGVICDEVETLATDVFFKLDKLEAAVDSAELKGRVCVCLIYRNADGLIDEAKKEIAYSTTINCDGIGECASPDARVDITSIKFNISPTDDGVTLSVDLSIIPTVMGWKNTELSLVEDVYTKERGCDNEYSDFPYTEHLVSFRYNDDFVTSLPLSDVISEELNDVIFSDSHVLINACECDENGLKMQGEIKFNCVACQSNDGGSLLYAPLKFTVPIEKYVNCSCHNRQLNHINCSISSFDTKVEIVENRIQASCLLDGSIRVFSDKKQRCVCASYLNDEEYFKDDSVVLVYYPDASETLFSIAKKFHTSVDEIAASNRLSQAVFSTPDSSLIGMGVNRLLIK